jgi:hypothetical protein
MGVRGGSIQFTTRRAYLFDLWEFLLLQILPVTSEFLRSGKVGKVARLTRLRMVKGFREFASLPSLSSYLIRRFRQLIRYLTKSKLFIMTLRAKLDELNKDIQRTIVDDDNTIEYYPLIGKIEKLSEYLNANGEENVEFLKWIKSTTKHWLTLSLKLCNEKIPKNTPNHRYKDQTINQIKKLVDDAVWWFKKGCKDTKITILDKEIS